MLDVRLLEIVSCFLQAVDVLNCMLTCQTLLLCEGVADKLLNEFAVKCKLMVQLENPASQLLRGLSGLSCSGYYTFSFKMPGQRPQTVQVSADSFPCIHSEGEGQGEDASISRNNAPFSILLNTAAGGSSLRLSCIKYFEVRPYPSTSTCTSSRCSFGISTYVSEGGASSAGHCYVYQHSGHICYNRSTIAQAAYHAFRPGDTLGCGVIYPPMGGRCGQVFFTRNGEVVHLSSLQPAALGCRWHAFVMHDHDDTVPSETEMMNMGISPFVFNLSAMEAAKARGQSFLSAHSTAGLLASLLRLRNVLTGSKTKPKGSLAACSYASMYAPQISHYSDSSAGSSPTGLPLASGTSSVDRIQQANSLFFSMDSIATHSSADTTKPRTPLVNFAEDSLLPPPPMRCAEYEEDADGCADSMAVELSSVDSFAVQDMRDISMADHEPPPPPASYARSWWIPPTTAAAETAASTTQSSVNTDCRVRDHDHEQELSDSSVATSLFVEVASLDEDGSYISYGAAACPADDEEDDWGVTGPSPFSASSRRPACCESEDEHEDDHSDDASAVRPLRGKRKRSSSCSAQLHCNKRIHCSSLSQGSGGGYVISRRGEQLGACSSNDAEDGYDGASEAGQGDDGHQDSAVNSDDDDDDAAPISACGGGRVPRLFMGHGSRIRRREPLSPSSLSMQGHAHPRKKHQTQPQRKQS